MQENYSAVSGIQVGTTILAIQHCQSTVATAQPRIVVLSIWRRRADAHNLTIDCNGHARADEFRQNSIAAADDRTQFILGTLNSAAGGA